MKVTIKNGTERNNITTTEYSDVERIKANLWDNTLILDRYRESLRNSVVLWLGDVMNIDIDVEEGEGGELK
jgi:hypothetical protein